MDLKTCIKCGEKKLTKHFFREMVPGGDGFTSRCRPCHLINLKETKERVVRLKRLKMLEGRRKGGRNSSKAARKLNSTKRVL